MIKNKNLLIVYQNSVMDKHGKIDDRELDKQTDTLLDNINSGDLDPTQCNL